MRRMTLLAAIAALVFSISATVTLATGDHHAPAKGVTNKVCPLMGDEVNAKIRTEHEGQYVYFCCSGCIDMFKADPAAAIAKMSDEDKAAIQKNETCPVTGEKIASFDTRVEHEGKFVYLCCAGCEAKFKKDAGATN